MNLNWNKRNTILVVTVGIYAVLALLINIIINNKAISAWISSTLSVISPLIIGAVIAYLCTPLLNMFESKVYRHIRNKPLRRVLSVICTYLLILLAITVILLIIIPQLKNSYNDFINNFSIYVNQAIAYINRFLTRFDSALENEQLGEYIRFDEMTNNIKNWLLGPDGGLQNLRSTIEGYAMPLVNGLKNFLIGLFISIYILSSKERLAAQIKKLLAALFGPEQYNAIIEWSRFANKTFGRYIKAQLLDALLVAVECAIAFSLLDLPYPMLLAFIIGVTNIIPVFGPFIGGIPAGFIVLIANPSKVLWFIVAILIIQQIDGNIVLPKLVGSSTGMTSFGVLCAITIMGGYFGILGMILGVPVFVVCGELIRQIVNKILQKKNLSVSLADYYAPESLIIPTDEVGAPRKKLLSRFFTRIVSKKHKAKNEEENPRGSSDASYEDEKADNSPADSDEKDCDN